MNLEENVFSPIYGIGPFCLVVVVFSLVVVVKSNSSMIMSGFFSEK